MRKFGLTTWIFIGIIAGVLLGWLVGEPLLVVSEPLGTAFLKLLKMVIVPLIVSSIISGVSGIGDSGRLGRLGLKTGLWVVGTSTIAILTGLVMVNIVQPGVGAELGLHKLPEGFSAREMSILDILIGIIPENPVKAAAEGQMLPLIFFSIVFGVFITKVDNSFSKPVQDFINGVFEVMMKVTNFVILLAPLGAFGLVATVVARTGFAPFPPLALYALCVLAGILIQATVTLPLLLRLVGGISPLKYVKAMGPALMTAFSTSSSSATLPLSIECTEENAGVSNRVSSFVLPLGATINMNGTALYECVAVLFIAQYYSSHGMCAPLTVTQQTLVVLTALLAAVGSAGIPMAGIVMMGVVLAAVGLPLEGIGLILAMDRILDMARTTLNVWGDHCGTAIIAATEGEKDLKVFAGNS